MSRILLITFLVAVSLNAQTTDDRYPFVRDGKLGFIDASGKEVIPAQFFPVGDFAHFSEGVAPVDGPDGAGFIDPSGRFVIGPQRVWGQPRPFYNGISVVLIWAKDRTSLNSPALIDRSGRIIQSGPSVIETQHFHPSTVPQPGWTGGCSEGLCPVEANGLWGYADPKGATIIPKQFVATKHFWHGLAQVAWNDGYGYINKTGRTVWRLRRP
jgi:hypothetical protein